MLCGVAPESYPVVICQLCGDLLPTKCFSRRMLDRWDRGQGVSDGVQDMSYAVGSGSFDQVCSVLATCKLGFFGGLIVQGILAL